MVTTYLRTFLTGDQTVNVRYPDPYDGTQTFVMVSRIGGPIDRLARGTWLDTAYVDVSCGAPKKSAAYDLTATVRAALAVMYSHEHSAGVVVNTAEQVGPSWIADPDYPGVGRYLLQVSVTVHP